MRPSCGNGERSLGVRLTPHVGEVVASHRALDLRQQILSTERTLRQRAQAVPREMVN